MPKLKPSLIYSLATGLVATIVYAYSTFATVAYVNEKHTQVKEDLTEIKDMLMVIDKRLYELKSTRGDK